MQASTNEQLLAMVGLMMEIIALRLGRMQFSPFGIFLRADGTFGQVGVEEGADSIEAIIERIKRTAPGALACGLVAMARIKDIDDECFFIMHVEDRGGGCSISFTNMARDDDGQYEVTDNGVQLPGIPQVFAVHH